MVHKIDPDTGELLIFWDGHGVEKVNITTTHLDTE